MPSKIQIISIIAGMIFGITFTLYTVSNAVPEWTKISIEDGTERSGLWRACTTYPYRSECHALACPAHRDDAGFCKRIIAGRAFMTLACIISGVITICFLISAAISDRYNRLLLVPAKILGFVCLIMGIIGVGVGGSISQLLRQSGNEFTFGVGAIVGVVAIIINFFGAIIVLFAKE
ncbi:hypothetical protein I4U23_002493 [Adineta vaga]|nr:hypothetical protein I4U23_002493 [Adineta vaga]